MTKIFYNRNTPTPKILNHMKNDESQIVSVEFSKPIHNWNSYFNTLILLDNHFELNNIINSRNGSHAIKRRVRFY